ncbi:DNA replication complex GINS family protein [Halobacterium salinarum]|uniref:DNA replication complex GINS family protein n=1 Tax=Halobacterium salinarum TaxID=2242 RepID=UPI0025567208|nr:DNA replication complex GINS family protein [Halobacterium salinarum]MDL0134089.1 DNA replication complex GINS family protein [Halobacterium salinarum]
MNLDDLRAAQTQERATDGLQDLQESFYADVAAFIESLKDRRDDAAAAATDPFGDPEVQELTDKIETAEQVTEAIYERRMGKLVKQASLAAAGMPDDQGGLTAEERDLYGDLVARIEDNKAHVLDVIAGDAASARPDGDDPADPGSPAPDSDAGDTSPRDASPPAGGSSVAAAMGGDDGGTLDPPPAPEPPGDGGADRVDTTTDGGVQSEPADDADVPDSGDAATARVRVRVTDTVGEILGVDERPYDLEAGDVVTLPEANADPLIEKDAAEKLD